MYPQSPVVPRFPIPSDVPYPEKQVQVPAFLSQVPFALKSRSMYNMFRIKTVKKQNIMKLNVYIYIPLPLHSICSLSPFTTSDTINVLGPYICIYTCIYTYMQTQLLVIDIHKYIFVYICIHATIVISHIYIYIYYQQHNKNI